MIFDAADEDGFAADVLQDASHIGMEARTELGVFEKGRAVLCAENDVQDDEGERLRHGRSCSAPLGLCRLVIASPRTALVPRLPWAGLRQALALEGCGSSEDRGSAAWCKGRSRQEDSWGGGLCDGLDMPFWRH